MAPLGTALTEEQLEELWRQSPSPALCFDGDAAGARAAARAVTASLPLLEPERTLRIVTLPDGEDPDTLVRRRGPDAFTSLLAHARPLHRALFAILREAAGHDIVADTAPEKRARFLAQLRAAADAIRHPALSKAYRSTLAAEFWELRAASRPGGGRSRQPPSAGSGLAHAHMRPMPGLGSVLEARAAALAATLIHHPGLLHDVEEAYAGVGLPPAMDRLRKAILSSADHVHALDSEAMADHLRTLGLGEEVSMVLSASPSFAKPETQPSMAEAGWWHIYGLMHRSGLEAEVAAAQQAWQTRPDQASFIRLNALVLALNRLRSGEQGLDDTETMDF